MKFYEEIKDATVNGKEVLIEFSYLGIEHEEYILCSGLEMENEMCTIYYSSGNVKIPAYILEQMSHDDSLNAWKLERDGLSMYVSVLEE